MALNVDDVFMGLRPRTAVGRAFATGRPRPDDPREVVEAALAHRVRNQIEAAYRRTDLFERRRKLMVDEVNPIRPTRFEDPKAGPFG